MANVTYLLGAGASANTIPIVNGISERFDVIITELGKIKNIKHDHTTFSRLSKDLQNNIDVLDQILDNLKWLHKESKKHQTIDTLARKYYLSDSSDLFKLKETLIQYFLIEQLLFIAPDYITDFKKKKEYRYDSFFAALLEKKDTGIKVKGNIKIVTWNYDQQIEIALKSYISGLSIRSIKEQFQIFPNHFSAESTQSIKFKLEEFGCLRLNGNAIWTPLPVNGVETPQSSLDYCGTDDLTLDFLLGILLKERTDMRTVNQFNHLYNSTKQMNFSWEEDEKFEHKYKSFGAHRTLLKEIAENTDCLVIIGYSFPVFNRDVDKLFFENLTRIKKVYIQDPNCESLKQVLINGFKKMNQFNGYNPNGFYLQRDISQFLIPFEVSEN